MGRARAARRIRWPRGNCSGGRAAARPARSAGPRPPSRRPAEPRPATRRRSSRAACLPTDPGMTVVVPELDVALARGVHCAYQPVVELATGRVAGYEALLRGPAGTAL